MERHLRSNHNSADWRSMEGALQKTSMDVRPHHTGRDFIHQRAASERNDPYVARSMSLKAASVSSSRHGAVGE